MKKENDLEPCAGTGVGGIDCRHGNFRLCRHIRTNGAVTKIATENEDAIWEQIEAVEEKSDAIFQRNAALWEKLDEICNALPDDYDFTDFDEAAFIRSTNALTEAEKETLLADIKELNELDAQMERCMRSCPTATICRSTRRHWKSRSQGTG